MKKTLLVVLTLVLSFCLMTSVSADDFNFGEVDVFDTTAAETPEEPSEETTEAPGTTETDPEQTTDPEESESESGSEPESESETESETTPETESSAEVETSEPEETTDASTTTGGEETTVQPSEGVTRPDDDDEDEKGDDEETSYLPFILIGVALAVFGVAGIVLIIILLKKYFGANKQ